jgi:hypothetical protein
MVDEKGEAATRDEDELYTSSQPATYVGVAASSRGIQSFVPGLRPEVEPALEGSSESRLG